jgi:hypothetical protein
VVCVVASPWPGILLTVSDIILEYFPWLRIYPPRTQPAYFWVASVIRNMKVIRDRKQFPFFSFLVCFLFCFVFNDSPGVSPQGHELARQVIYTSAMSRLFCFSYFWNKVSHLCLGRTGLRSSYLASHITGMTDAGACYHTQLFFFFFLVGRGFELRTVLAKGELYH